MNKMLIIVIPTRNRARLLRCSLIFYTRHDTESKGL